MKVTSSLFAVAQHVCIAPCRTPLIQRFSLRGLVVSIDDEITFILGSNDLLCLLISQRDDIQRKTKTFNLFLATSDKSLYHVFYHVPSFFLVKIESFTN